MIFQGEHWQGRDEPLHSLIYTFPAWPLVGHGNLTQQCYWERLQTLSRANVSFIRKNEFRLLLEINEAGNNGKTESLISDVPSGQTREDLVTPERHSWSTLLIYSGWDPNPVPSLLAWCCHNYDECQHLTAWWRQFLLHSCHLISHWLLFWPLLLTVGASVVMFSFFPVSLLLRASEPCGHCLSFEVVKEMRLSGFFLPPAFRNVTFSLSQ